MNWSAIAAILLGLAVVLGAFGAHSLRARFDAYSMRTYEKAVFYHFIHALGLLVVSILPQSARFTPEPAPGCPLLRQPLSAGPDRPAHLGAITPLGGLTFIAAWFLLVFGLFRQ